MINRIRAIRKEQGMTLAGLAQACDPPTTAQTIGRLETGTRTLSVKWMERIGAALGVDPEALLRSDTRIVPQIIAVLESDGADALSAREDALAPGELGGDAARVVMRIAVSAGEYRAGDQLWLKQIAPEDSGSAINRDVLVPRKGGRFAFGRLIDRQERRVGILPPGVGQKQIIVEDPRWLAVAETLVRSL